MKASKLIMLLFALHCILYPIPSESMGRRYGKIYRQTNLFCF